MRMRKKFMMITLKKRYFFPCRTRTEHFNLLEKNFKELESIFSLFKKKHLKYDPKCYSKATYDLKRALIKHPLFQLFNMNDGYNEKRGNGTKWSCQNPIKSKSKSNQKSNPKQEFKLKPVSNASSGYLQVNLLWYLSC